MGRRIVDVDAPDRFVAAEDDTADPDHCYLEVVRRGRRMSVTLERELLARVVDGLLRLVDELERRGLVAIEIEPVESMPPKRGRRHAFHAEALSLDWDEDGHRVVVEARSPEPGGAGESAPPPGASAGDEAGDVLDDDPVGADILRVRLTPHMAQRFARQAGRIARGPTHGPQGPHRPGGPGTDRPGD